MRHNTWQKLICIPQSKECWNVHTRHKSKTTHDIHANTVRLGILGLRYCEGTGTCIGNNEKIKAGPDIAALMMGRNENCWKPFIFVLNPLHKSAKETKPSLLRSISYRGKITKQESNTYNARQAPRIEMQEQMRLGGLGGLGGWHFYCKYHKWLNGKLRQESGLGANDKKFESRGEIATNDAS